MIRIVLDTNIVVSAFLWGGKPQQLIAQAIEKGVILVTTRDIFQEIEKTISKPKFDGQFRLIGKTRLEIAREYAALTTQVPPTAVLAGTVRDVKDEMILAAAIGGRADYIVSGDKDLTDLAAYEGIRILTPTQFLAVLNALQAAEDQSQSE